MCTQPPSPALNTPLPTICQPFWFCHFLQLLLILFGVIQTNLQPEWVYWRLLWTMYLIVFLQPLWTHQRSIEQWSITAGLILMHILQERPQTFIWHHLHSQSLTLLNNLLTGLCTHELKMLGIISFYSNWNSLKHLSQAFSLFGMQKHPEFKMKPLWPTDFH